MTLKEAGELPYFENGNVNNLKKMKPGIKYISGIGNKLEEQLERIKKSKHNIFFFFEVINDKPLELKFRSEKIEDI